MNTSDDNQPIKPCYFFYTKSSSDKNNITGFSLVPIEKTTVLGFATESSERNKKHNIKVRSTGKLIDSIGGLGAKPLIIVDGKTMPQSDTLSNLKPSMIESISVLKNTSATNKYGEKAKNGAIILEKLQFPGSKILNIKDIKNEKV